MADAEEYDDGYVHASHDESLLDSQAVTKYRFAADVVNRALEKVVASIVPGASILDVCTAGDEAIETFAGEQFKSKDILKGVAFPTCISVDDVVCHYSPLRGDVTESDILKPGSVVKIDMGAHVEGFIGVVAHTVVVPNEDGSVPDITGPTADVMTAAYAASQIAVRMAKNGCTNEEITDMVARVGEAYGVTAVQGILMHQLKQYIIDGNKVVSVRKDVDYKVDHSVFETGEAYGIDVVMSTGDGKPRQTGVRNTVFKRAQETGYMLKMKTSKTLLTQIQNKYPVLGFTLRAFDDEKTARMGVVELLKHGLLHEYPVLVEKEGAVSAHFKSTALLMAGGTMKATGMDLPSYVKSDKSLPEDLQKLLNTSTFKPKSRRRKAKK
jgi:curved DNA binding protein